MTIQQHMVQLTRNAANDIFRYAEAVPGDKLEWVPLEGGRTILDQIREVALSASWPTMLMTHRALPEFTPEFLEKFELAKAAIPSVAAAKEAHEQNFAEFESTALAFPDADLENTLFIPFGAGRDWTYREIMGMHLWNCHYHQGQIAYIQTLYGDHKMY